MKHKIRYLIISFFSILLTADPATAQTISQKYELDFAQIPTCNPSWFPFRRNCAFINDPENMEHGKPVFKLFYKNFAAGDSLKFQLSKTIILPVDASGKKCNISIISKDDVNHDLLFKVTGLDKYEKVTESKTIKINSKSWKESLISIIMANVVAIRVNIYYNGDRSPKQDIWIDKILIKSDGKDITQGKYFSGNLKDTLKTIQGLNRKFLVPLVSGNDSTLLTGIKELRGKKVIGIAECTHGSNSVGKANYQFIKNLVVNHHARLILLELPTDKCLMWNLYIQGRIGKNYSKEIEDDMKNIYTDYGLLMGFLDWLRDFNRRHENEVYLYGIDNPRLETKFHLFNFHLALQGKNEGLFYLKNAAVGNLEDMSIHAQLDTALKKRLGTKNFECYQAILNEQKTLRHKSADYFDDRDSNMYIRARNFINIFIKKGDKTVILAHSGHLQNLDRKYLINDIPSGYYFRKNYGSAFFSISFQIGKGEITQDICTGTSTIIEKLPTPPLYSFEYAGLATGLNYFYYPATHLGDAILASCFITRQSRYHDLYKFSSLRKEFDAYVFIKDSEPIKNIVPDIGYYAYEHYYSQKAAMDSIMQRLK